MASVNIGETREAASKISSEPANVQQRTCSNLFSESLVKKHWWKDASSLEIWRHYL